MAALRQRVVFEIARGVTAFLNLDAGLTRDAVPDPERLEGMLQDQGRELEQTRTQLREQEQALKEVRSQVGERERDLDRARERISELEKANAANSPGLSSGENIIWVFGTIRTGSTWLGFMMRDLEGFTMWNEPRVGELFGYFFYGRAAHRKENKNFILGLDRKTSWLQSIRNFILDAVAEKYPGISKEGYLVIKEPSGSIGAPLLAEAIPESRLILLVRDPRDVVASALDASREGSWTRELKGSRKRRENLTNQPIRVEQDELDDKDPDEVVREQASMYLQYVGNSRQAYDTHEGPKTMIRYEELLEDTLGTMKRLYRELDIPVDEQELARVVEKHSWKNIPEEEKGEGKFYRKGQAGSWREDLTPEQVEVVEEITAPLLQEFYSETKN